MGHDSEKDDRDRYCGNEKKLYNNVEFQAVFENGKEWNKERFFYATEFYERQLWHFYPLFD